MVPPPTSEFNLQLQQIRDQEESVKKAIETSDMLLKLKPQSSARLKEISTHSRLPNAMVSTS